MNQKSTRKIGDEYENEVLDMLAPHFSKTAGSGSVFKDGDLKNKEFVLEAKVRPTSGASVAGKDLSKLIKRATLEGKDWLFACKNYDNLSIIMMDINTFAMMHESSLIAEALRAENPELYQQLYNSIK